MINQKLRYNCKIMIDGNMWCALVGEDLQNGVGGFGKTLPEAFEDLAVNIRKWVKPSDIYELNHQKG